MLIVAGGLRCPKAHGLLARQPGFEPASPASEGRFLTTEPPRKPPRVSFANPLSNCPPTRLYQLLPAESEAPVSKGISCTVPSPEGMAVSPGSAPSDPCPSSTQRAPNKYLQLTERGLHLPSPSPPPGSPGASLSASSSTDRKIDGWEPALASVPEW